MYAIQLAPPVITRIRDLVKQVHQFLLKKNSTDFVLARITLEIILGLIIDESLPDELKKEAVQCFIKMGESALSLNCSLVDVRQFETVQQFAAQQGWEDLANKLQKLAADILKRLRLNVQTNSAEQELDIQVNNYYLKAWRKENKLLQSAQEKNDFSNIAAFQKSLSEIEHWYHVNLPRYYQQANLTSLKNRCGIARTKGLSALQAMLQEVKTMASELVVCGEQEEALNLYKMLFDYLRKSEIERKNTAQDLVQFNKLELLNEIFNINQQQLNQSLQTVSAHMPQSKDWQRYRHHLTAMRAAILQQQRVNVPVQKVLRQLTQSFKELLSTMIADSITILGPAPCEFAFLGFGSFGREVMLPYSDLEFCLLIAESTEHNLAYFKTLLKFINFKVESLGESEEQHLGFHLDEAVRPERDPRLLGSPEAVVKGLFKSDFSISSNAVLVFSMLKPALIMGNSQLLVQYDTAVRQNLNKVYENLQVPFYKVLAQELIESNIKDFQELITTGNSVEVKKQYDSFLTGFCQLFGLYYDAMEANCEATLNTLVRKQVLAPVFAEHYKSVMATVADMRLQLQLHYKEPEDRALLSVSNEANLFVLNKQQQYWLFAAKYSLIKPLINIMLKHFFTASIKYYDITCDNYETMLVQLAKKAAMLPDTQEYFQILLGDLKTVVLSFDETVKDDYTQTQNLPAESHFIKYLWQQAFSAMTGKNNDPLHELLQPILIKEDDSIKEQQVQPQQTAHYDLILKAVIYRLVTGQADQIEYERYYGSLIEPVRPLFIKSLEAVLGKSLLEHPFLDSLYHFPNSDGWRPIMAERTKQWHDSLKLLFQSKVQDANQPRVVTYDLDVPEQDKLRTYLLTPEVAEQLFTASGDFKPKPKNQPGRHVLLPIEIKGKRFWFKLQPEQPGTEVIVHEMAERLNNGSTPKILLVKFIIKNKNYAVQIAEHIEGDSLEYVLRNCPERVRFIERKSLLRAFRHMLQISPEDDKPDDYFLEPFQRNGTTYYRLKRNDNERAFNKAESEQKTLLKINKELIVKSIIPCLNFMREAVQPDEFDDFMLIYQDLYYKSILKTAIKTHQYFRRLWTDEEIRQAFLNKVPGPSLLTVGLANGWAKEMLNRHESIRTILTNMRNSHLTITPMDILKAVQPELAQYYKDIFDQVPADSDNEGAALLRFDLVTKGLYEKNQGRYQSKIPTAQAVSQSLRVEQVFTAEQVLIIVRGDANSPFQALQELNKLVEQRDSKLDVQRSLLKCEKNSIQVFQQLTVRHQLLIINDIIEMLNRSADSIPEEQQRHILKAIAGTPFHSIILTPFRKVLDDTLLAGILQGTKNHLLELDISSCNLLTNASLNLIGGVCPNLKKLVFRTGNLSEIQVNLLPSLLVLDLSKNQQLVKVTIAAPLLTYCNISHCDQLSHLVTASQRLKILDLRSCDTLWEHALIHVCENPYQLEQVYLRKEAVPKGLARIGHQVFREKYPFLLTFPLNQFQRSIINMIGQAIDIVIEEGTIDATAIRKNAIFVFNNLKQWANEISYAKTELLKLNEGHELKLREATEGNEYLVNKNMPRLDEKIMRQVILLLGQAGTVFFDLTLIDRLYLHLLSDKIEPPLAAEIAIALAQNHPELIDRFLEALKLGNSPQLLRAIALTGYLVSKQPKTVKSKAVRVLLAMLNNQSTNEIKLAAINALGDLCDPDELVIQALKRELRASSFLVKSAIIRALNKLGVSIQEPVEALLNELKVVPVENKALFEATFLNLIDELGYSSQNVISLLTTMLDNESQKAVAIKIIGKLGRFSQAEIAMLSANLASTEPKLRFAAVKGIQSVLSIPYSQYSILKKLEEIIIISSQLHGEILIQTLQQLAQADVRIVDMLLKQLGDEDLQVKLAVIETLKSINTIDNTSFELLLLFLGQKNVKNSKEAIKALGSLITISSSVNQALLEQLHDPNFEVKNTVVKTLNHLYVPDPNIIAKLFEMLSARDVQLQIMAAITLVSVITHVKDLRAALVDFLEKNSFPASVTQQLKDQQNGTLKSLQSYYLAALAVITSNFSHKDANMREFLIETIRSFECHTTEIDEALLNRLATEKKRPVTLNIIKALAKTNYKYDEVTQRLLEELENNNEDVRATVVMSLGQRQKVEANVVKALYERLFDDSEKVRYEATQTLGHLSFIKGRFAIYFTVLLRRSKETLNVRLAAGKVLEQAFNLAPSFFVMLIKEALVPLNIEVDLNAGKHTGESMAGAMVKAVLVGTLLGPVGSVLRGVNTYNALKANQRYRDATVEKAVKTWIMQKDTEQAQNDNNVIMPYSQVTMFQSKQPEADDKKMRRRAGTFYVPNQLQQPQAEKTELKNQNYSPQ